MSKEAQSHASAVESRAATGCEGLDDILGGGFTPNRLYLLEGLPGSGKTTLALQFLMEGVRRGERVLHITLSESLNELHATAASHGWSLEGITIRELAPSADSLRPDDQYTMFHPSEVELGETTKAILGDVERVHPTRVVFDSLSEFRLLAGNPLRYRRQILALKQFFSGRKCTVMLLDDMTSSNQDLQVQSIAHAVVRLEQKCPEYGAERRRLIVIKYRGARFRGGYHDFKIIRGGLDVYPRLVACENRTPPNMEKLASGIAEFDTLLGGGIERGTSTLIVGAAGTGKSSLSAQFVATAAARGQKSAMFIFDESVHTLLTRAAGLGINLRKHMDEGQVAIRQVDPAELSPGELVHCIRQSVEEQGVAVVVIDSLNGYLNAMPEENFLVTQLHELLTYLGQAGVATILVGAHQGLIGANMVTPVDASYLADAVILLRYFESKGEVRQAISVVKKRGSAHERSIREFRLENGRISVGRALRDFRGILTGVPVYERERPIRTRKEPFVTEAERLQQEARVLVLAPTPKDAALTSAILERAQLACCCCSATDQLCVELRAGAAAVIIPEEAFAGPQSDCLAEALSDQPPWSDLPILILAHAGADSPAVARSMELLGNVTVLERPVRVAALVSAVRTAVRARRRQYQIRDSLAERERSIEAQAFLAAIVTSSDDAIYSKSLEGIIFTWNTAAERLFGYSATEAIGRPIKFLIPPERQDEEHALLDRLRSGERIQHFETVRVTREGKLLDVSLTLSPIWGAEDKILGASIIARDITQRKQAEEVLRQADRRKDEFLAILAHELRNPLAPIRNSLHILRMNTQHDAATERVGEMMERQVNHMVRLVDDLLEVSRITRGKVELRLEPIELAAVVRSAVETSAPQIEASGHQLAMVIPPEPLTLNGDSVRLTQVLANLLNNAAKYTPAGGQIWLTIRSEDQEVVISVRDTGMGIPADMLPHVFKFFTQVDRQEERAQGGLGIGLTLVKSLVEMHGGNVTAHSDGPGKGSEFVIRLPLVAGLRPVDTILPEGRPSALSARRLLVVDDNRDSAESMGMLLKMLGAEVHVVFGAQEALDAVATYKPAAVVLDIGLPEMDGYEVARRIRSDPEYQDITLIALTGWGQDEDRLRSQMAGFDYHLVKPANLDALTALLTSLESRPSSRPNVLLEELQQPSGEDRYR